MGTDILYIKTGDIYKDTAKDVETRSGASNYELNGPLRKEKNKVISVVKDDLGGKIKKEFVELTAKTQSYLIGNCSEDK